MTLRAPAAIRTVARGIDLIIVLAVADAFGEPGWLMGFFFLLLSDALFEGESPGKKLTGLHVVGATGAAATVRDSVIRNAPLAAGFVLFRIPLIGWLLFAAVLAFEGLVMIGNREGKRLGDHLAQTQVLDKDTEVKENDIV